mmetsp:Transcript_33931/g.83384  ORF Transcript_33931/g.83384 Transcript_33931/m.83384 type:complete len:231 (-) Transcript_33931:18-710(-)
MSRCWRSLMCRTSSSSVSSWRQSAPTRWKAPCKSSIPASMMVRKLSVTRPEGRGTSREAAARDPAPSALPASWLPEGVRPSGGSLSPLAHPPASAVEVPPPRSLPIVCTVCAGSARASRGAACAVCAGPTREPRGASERPREVEEAAAAALAIDVAPLVLVEGAGEALPWSRAERLGGEALSSGSPPGLLDSALWLRTPLRQRVSYPSAMPRHCGGCADTVRSGVVPAGS